MLLMVRRLLTVESIIYSSDDLSSAAVPAKQTPTYAFPQERNSRRNNARASWVGRAIVFHEEAHTWEEQT